jgi:RNA polymerase-interacting CarD/CdnL/TRCF family regulator
MCSKEGMQSALNIFQSYCDKWKLTVNVNKTKVLVFSKRKCQQNFDFTLNGEKLDVIDSAISNRHSAKILKWSSRSFKNTENKKGTSFRLA